MKRLRNRYSRGPVGLPGVLVLAGVALLWQLWPDVPKSARGGREQPAMLYAYIRHMPERGTLREKPDLFGMLSPVGFRMPGDDGGIPVAPPPERKPARPVLIRKPDGLSGGGHTPLPPLDTLAREELVSYDPFWQDEPVFSNVVAGKSAVGMVLSESLIKAGMVIDKMQTIAPEEGRTGWLVVVSVSLCEDGRVDHVFVESGSGVTAIDQAVVRVVARAKTAEPPGKPVRGRVSVGFGR
jgi:TonB family protein